MIHLQGLSKTYRSHGSEHAVLDNVELEVRSGEFVSIFGRSGSGKTTLLHLIGGLDRQYRGSIEVDGCNLATLSDRALSRFRARRIAFVLQEPHLLEHLSCLENVALPGLFGGYGAFSEPARRRAADLLDRVGLGELATARPTRLSGGESQRVAIARALFNHPRVLICDELTGDLDSQTAVDVLALLDEIQRDRDLTVVAATHDEAVARSASRVLRLVEGALRDVPPEATRGGGL